MTFLRKTISSLLLATCFTVGTMAQTNGSNSSYSRFGLGTMNEQAEGFNRGMSGLSQGLRSGSIVNMLNPASYSGIDSLTFIFDVGMGMQYGHMKQGGSTLNARNATLDNVNAGFRLAKGLGMSFGFVPYSTIGFSFTRENRVGNDFTTSHDIKSKTTYYGNGGLHEMYVGLGWNPVHKLSIGANVGYVWGDYNNSLSQSFIEGSTTSSNYNSARQEITSDVKTYKVDLGLQYPVRLTRRDWLTLGLSATLGHNVGSKVEMIRYTSGGDTIASNIKNAISLPYTFGGGLAWQHEGRIIVGADYFMEKWSGCKLPVANQDAQLSVTDQEYMDRHKMVFGAQYIQNPMGRKYGERIEYKIGASYSTPYVRVNGHDGPSEYGASAGLALPLTTSYASRSRVNVAVQWLHRAPNTSTLIKENYVVLHLGVTFNERWFMKWKIQ